MHTRSILLILTLLISSCADVASNLDTPPPAGASAGVVNEIEPAEALPLVQAAYSQFVDVRTPEEYAAGHAARAINIHFEGQLPEGRRMSARVLLEGEARPSDLT
jgi:hypothetical protein